MLSRIKEEEEEFLKTLLKNYPNVIGYSRDYCEELKNNKPTGYLALRVYVSKKVPKSELHANNVLPDFYNGIPVDVIEVGTLEAPRPIYGKKSVDYKLNEVRPLVAGISIGNINITAGTLGWFFKDKSGTVYLGSNSHVFCPDPSKPPSQVSPKEIVQPGCYSEDTKVLTKRGFIYFYEVLGDDEVLTFNLGSGELEWQKPLKIHKYRYTGPMVHFSGQMYDLLVTPNHNMVIRRYGSNKWFLVRAEQILQRQFNINAQELGRARDLTLQGYTHATLELPKTGIWRCSDLKELKIGDCRIPIDEWLQFLGFWLAEGSVYKGKKGCYGIFLRNFDFTKLQHMAQLLKKWGFSPCISKYGQLQFCSKHLFFWLSMNCFTKPYDSLPKGRKAYYKRMPPEFKELPPERLKVLLTWLFRGDGTFERGLLRRYTTSSKRLAEDVTEIALKCGHAVSICERKGEGLYKVGISNRNITPRITKQPNIVYYDGYVYCLTVPNHTMVVERNGKVSICGNSYDGATLSQKVGNYAWHQQIYPTISMSNCPIGKGISNAYNFFAEKLNRKTRLYPILQRFNTIDFAVSFTDAPIVPKIIDIDVKNGWKFVGLLFAGSENTTVICKAENLIKTGYSPIEPLNSIAEPKVGLSISKSGRTTCQTKGTIIDSSGVVTVSYGTFEATFYDVIISDIKSAGGDSGSCIITLE